MAESAVAPVELKRGQVRRHDEATGPGCAVVTTESAMLPAELLRHQLRRPDLKQAVLGDKLRRLVGREEMWRIDWGLV